MVISYPECIPCFNAVLQEEGSAHDVVNNSIGDEGVVDSVQVGGSVKRVVDAAPLHV